MATAERREAASSDRLPSIGVSLQPAIPRRVAPQQSPPPLHRSPIEYLRLFRRCRSGARSATPFERSQPARSAFGLHAVSRRSCRPPTGVSSLLCAPGDICILRRQRRALTLEQGFCGKKPRMSEGSDTALPCAGSIGRAATSTRSTTSLNPRATRCPAADAQRDAAPRSQRSGPRRPAHRALPGFVISLVTRRPAPLPLSSNGIRHFASIVAEIVD